MRRALELIASECSQVAQGSYGDTFSERRARVLLTQIAEKCDQARAIALELERGPAERGPVQRPPVVELRTNDDAERAIRASPDNLRCRVCGQPWVLCSHEIGQG